MKARLTKRAAPGSVKARLTKRAAPGSGSEPAPNLLTAEESEAFFGQLEQMPLADRLTTLRAELKRNPGISTSKLFIEIAIRLADELREYDITWE